MYIPRQFEQTDVSVLHSCIKAYPLGALVTMTSDGLDAEHIPFLVQAEPLPCGTLHGHVARANPVWRAHRPNADALVLFQGPDIFISPSSYQTKRDSGKVVPTWNYVVVHAHGSLRFIDDPAWVRAHVEALTTEHEGKRGAPWKVTDAPEDFIDAMVTALVGLEIRITGLVGKWKVSQNRSAADREGVIESLTQDGSERSLAMAELVRRAGTA